MVGSVGGSVICSSIVASVMGVVSANSVICSVSAFVVSSSWIGIALSDSSVSVCTSSASLIASGLGEEGKSIIPINHNHYITSVNICQL